MICIIYKQHIFLKYIHACVCIYICTHTDILYVNKTFISFAINHLTALYIYIYIYTPLKSKVYTPLAEYAKCFIFDQVRGIIQNACYCLFSTDVNMIFTYSQQDKIIVEFITMH